MHMCVSISPWNVNFISFLILFILCMGVFPASMSVHRVSAWCLKRLEKVSDGLKLEWQAIVSCRVGVGR